MVVLIISHVHGPNLKMVEARNHHLLNSKCMVASKIDTMHLLMVDMLPCLCLDDTWLKLN